MTTKKVTTHHAASANVHEENGTVAASPAATPHSTAKAHPSVAPVAAPAVALLTAEQIQQILVQLDAIAAILASGATPLSIEERRQQPKMKKGGEQQVPDVLNLADRYKVSIPGGGTAEARADLALAAALQPLVTRLAAMASLVDDTILQANSRAWETTTTLYSMLVRLVKRFPALQGELQPMASFMARIHKTAPTNLRKAEASSLAKGRATRKAKKDKAAATAASAETSAATGTSFAAPPAPPTSGNNVTAAPAAVMPAAVPAGRSN